MKLLARGEERSLPGEGALYVEEERWRATGKTESESKKAGITGEEGLTWSKKKDGWQGGEKRAQLQCLLERNNKTYYLTIER